MGLFDKSSELEKTIRDINSQYYYDLSAENFYEHVSKVGNESVFCNILKTVTSTFDDIYTIKEKLNFIVDKIYPVFVHNDLSGLDEFYSILKIYSENPNLITDTTLNNIQFAFNDKKIIVDIYKYLNSDKVFGGLDDIDQENINTLTEYLIKARLYYVEDRALLSSFVNLVNLIGIDVIRYGDAKKISKGIKAKLKEDAKANGIYDIDQAALKEIDRKIESLGLVSERLDTLVKIAENQGKILDETISGVNEEISRVRVAEIKSLRDEANKIIKEFKTTYLELLGQEKETIANQTDEIMAMVDKEIDKKKIDLLNIGDSVGQRVGIEISRIRNASTSSIKKIEEFISSNENVKKLLSEAKSDEDFLSKLKQVEQLVNNGEGVQISTPVSQVSVSERSGTSVLDGLIIPSLIIPKEREIDPNINYYFDTRIPYKDRFNQLMEKKQELIEKGEIFHEKFDDILAMIIQNDAPYMYGPSGCGKTYMIERQLAKLLGTTVLTNGYIMYEQDVLGYTNSGTGAYVPTNFYRCYKFGDTIFFDELDNGIANSTTVLNSFLTSKPDSSYVFPNGELVKKHPNFRIVSAGNTKGAGKTVAHNTRQKLDESVMQRLTPVEVKYDNRIEKNILKDYPGWYEFAVAFRSSISSLGSHDEENTIGTFTTRDAETIKKYKDDEVFTDEQLMDYQIIENKDEDYIRQIKRKMENSDFESEEGKKLLKVFNNRVEERFGT